MAKTTKKQKVKIDYPRHWHFSCSGFTCYIESDEENKITKNSTGFAGRYVGMDTMKFGKMINRRFGGVWAEEFDKNGKRL